MAYYSATVYDGIGLYDEPPCLQYILEVSKLGLRVLFTRQAVHRRSQILLNNLLPITPLQEKLPIFRRFK
jgi:hypothetical protein